MSPLFFHCLRLEPGLTHHKEKSSNVSCIAEVERNTTPPLEHVPLEEDPHGAEVMVEDAGDILKKWHDHTFSGTHFVFLSPLQSFPSGFHEKETLLLEANEKPICWYL